MAERHASLARSIALVIGVCLVSTHAGGAGLDPFLFLAPDVRIDGAERIRLNADQPVVEVQPSKDGFLSLTAITRVNATGERLAAWASHVEALQRGRYVTEIGRFSDPPRLEDLRELTIDVSELDDLLECRPGDCQIKLSAGEIAQVRSAGNRRAVDGAFRRILVARATAYLRDGAADAASYHDHKYPVDPANVFASLIARTPFFVKHFRCYDEYLRSFPLPARTAEVRESFLYWSKESLGMKPIISITHFSQAWFDRPDMPTVVIVAKQVYASHYKDASMTMTALTGDATSRYLVYINRSHVDAFRGFFGGIVRRTVERRVKAEAPGVLRGLRQRIESGDPPARALSVPAVPEVR